MTEYHVAIWGTEFLAHGSDCPTTETDALAHARQYVADCAIPADAWEYEIVAWDEPTDPDGNPWKISMGTVLTVTADNEDDALTQAHDALIGSLVDEWVMDV